MNQQELEQSGTRPQAPRFWSLTGFVGYEETKALQQKLVDLRAQDLIPDTILFLEHKPVITRGRGLQWTGVPRERHMPPPAYLPEGTEFCESERGGDLTWHGPGQLVIYPICKLDGSTPLNPHHDIGAFLRGQERLFCEVLDQGYGLASARIRENATGVWLGEESAPRKIASIGIAVRRWVIWHGHAINLVNDLKPFHLISPCGFQPEVMTRLSDWVSPEKATRAEFERRFSAHWVRSGGVGETVEIRRLSLQDALESL
jgi:lipoyl(octanoyl) transferase